ncbi:armadillo repeat-containing protein 3-like isoform X3 [Phyllopteryx taeniolatus]|uniref:armadillo repeat-containing protein 3-like isoform X3 n=1 Tax=Phyllopteryx taeniolatus TaxID=161469 RepID=UPI002AD45E3F|nr:armadillo repeat-containing protein 3-like isoform X3 [Phyllopteryx taeniolatus]
MDKKDKKERKSKCSTPCKETFEPLRVDVKTTATAVLLLSSPEEDIVVTACEAIFEFAEEDANKVYLMELGALQRLTQLIAHTNELVRRNAFMILGTVASHSAVGNALQQMDVIAPIIDKLSLDDSVIQEYGTLCLSYLSLAPSCKVQIFDNKGLPALIKLLSSSEPDVQKNSLETIYNLIQNSQFCPYLLELGGIPLLLELLNSDYAVIQQLALKTLQKVTADKESHGTIRKEQGLDKLISIIQNVDFCDLHVEALQVLVNCASDSDNFHLVRNGGGLTTLLELVVTRKLSETGSPVKCNTNEVQSRAVECISTAAQNSDNHKVLHDFKVEEILVDLLSGNSDCVKTFVCQAMAGMSSFLSSKERFRDLGGLPALTRLLSSGNLLVRGEAIQALANLTAGHKQNSMTIYEEGGHKILVQRLRDSCPRIAANAAAILCRIAGEEAIRCDVLSLGAIPALVEPLRSTDSQVLINATLCICELAFDASARAELCFGQKVLTLAELSMEPVNQRLPIVVVNAAIEVFLHQKSVEEGYQTERYWKVINDVALRFLVKEVKESIALLNDEQEQYVALARQVSDVMGGAIEKEDLHTFGWLLHICLLKCKVQCNVVPIGMISKGFYCHRALLFKYLADCIGLSCTLVRGDYNRAWNEVLLRNEHSSQPRRYIVDLMHQPGSFLRTPRGGPVPRLRSACALMKIADSKRVTSRHLSL